MRLPVGFGALGRAFRLRNYRLYVIGSIASNIGIWVQRVALGWLAWQLTESTAWLGGIAVAEVGPMIAFGLIAGTIVDRMDYLKLLRLTQACGVTVAATITALVSAMGLGAWSGGFYLASRAGGPKGMTTITLSCMALANLGLLAFVATGALWGTLWVALPLMVLMGAAFIMQGIGNQTLIQAAVDPDFRGRVISLYGITVRGMPAIGALIVGAIAETQGLALPVAGGALVCLLVWAWAWRNRSFYADNLETETAAEAAPAKAASAD